MDERYSREAMLLGDENIEKLFGKRVLVCGVGGVGSFICEGLARGGIGHIDLLDSDTVSKSNINRQLIALESTVGMKKTSVMAQRIKDINPDIEVRELPVFLTEDNMDLIAEGGYDYIADAIDSTPSKIALICRAQAEGIPIISSMGTGNKLDPFRFKITDISKTSVCPLAKKLRYELKKRGIRHHRVLFSDEEPIRHDGTDNGRKVPGSISFVPPCAGLMIAGDIIKTLIKSEE